MAGWHHWLNGVWVNSWSWWWTGRPGVLWFMELQRVGHDWVTELNWTELIIAFFPRSKRPLISWLQSPSAVILEPKKIKSVTVSIVSPSVCHEMMGLDAMILVSWMLGFKPAFSLSSFTFIKRLFTFSSPIYTNVRPLELSLKSLRHSSFYFFTPFCETQLFLLNFFQVHWLFCHLLQSSIKPIQWVT